MKYHLFNSRAWVLRALLATLALRHYHLSRLINLGHDPALVSRRAGHSRISTTTDIYVDAFESQVEGLAVSFEELGEKPKGEGATTDGTTTVRPMGRAEQGDSGSEGE